jgi:hypothetical protein
MPRTIIPLVADTGRRYDKPGTIWDDLPLACIAHLPRRIKRCRHTRGVLYSPKSELAQCRTAGGVGLAFGFENSFFSISMIAAFPA